MPLPAPPNRWRPKPPPRRPKMPGNISVNTPGYTPDWKSILENDPRYQQKKGFFAGQSAAQKAARNASIKAKLIAFGSLPDLQGIDLGDFGLDPDTIAAIQANTNPNTSETAKMQRQNATNIQSLQDMLAARGMLRSGSLGVGLGQEQERHTAAQTTAREELLRVLAGFQSQFAADEAQREQDLAEFGEGVKDDLEDSGLYEPRPGSTVKAQRDPVTGLYRDADGNYYDRDGNPVRDPNRRPGFGPFQAAQRPLRRYRVPNPPRPYNPGYRP